MRPRNKIQECRGQLQSCKLFAQAARCGVEYLAPQDESRFGEEMKAIQVGMLKMRIFLIARGG
jgi:hypothetical protein